MPPVREKNVRNVPPHLQNASSWGHSVSDSNLQTRYSSPRFAPRIFASFSTSPFGPNGRLSMRGAAVRERDRIQSVSSNKELKLQLDVEKQKSKSEKGKEKVKEKEKEKGKEKRRTKRARASTTIERVC
jgi:hypothetical protein